MKLLTKQGKTVVLGISGGVDSAIAGFILKSQGFKVHGLFMRNWDIVDETGDCSQDRDIEDAVKSCSILGIPFHEVDFSKDYWNYVFTDFIEQYQRGITPNPDVLCNRYIKFKSFFKYAIEKLGADAIATGHYAQTSFGQFLECSDETKGVHLLKAHDSGKDQTFFLNQIHQDALQKTMFPLGNLKKTEVKKIAIEKNLDYLLKKKESSGICFIGNRNFPRFISEYLPERKGSFINIDTGQVVGSHNGVHHWTVGQRCRIGGSPGRFYVAKKILMTQDIFVALGKQHLSLWSQHITTSRCHWIHSVPEVLSKGGVLQCEFRFQHRQPLIPCRVMLTDNCSLIIILQKALYALTPGQYAVLYKDNECLGGAQIENTSPCLYSIRVKQNILGRDWTHSYNYIKSHLLIYNECVQSLKGLSYRPRDQTKN